MGLANAYALRAKLRPYATNKRVRDCGRRPISGQPAVVVQEFKSHRCAWWLGVLRCGRQHSCPVCAAKKAAERADELDRMMQGDPCGRWQMVTLTLRHHAGERLEDLLAELMGALRRVRRTRAIRAVFDLRVTATVRALEVTWGANGWHPHVHLLMRTSEWTRYDRETLAQEWRRAIPGRTVDGVAVVWSTPIESWHSKRALYLTKLGAEVAGVEKRCKNGNLTPWQIAERAVNDERARARWAEYQNTMKGRRLLELDERAKALVLAAPPAEEPERVWRCDMFAEEFAELVKLERLVPTILWEVLETAIHSGADPPAQVRITVDDALGAQKAA